MTTNKFLTLALQTDKWIQKLVTAVSSFTGNANEIVATGANGKISVDLISPLAKTLATSEDLSPGDLVRIFDDTDTGTATAGLADATSYANRAEGYVLAATTSPANAIVYFDGIIAGFSGLTPGDPVYTSLAPGEITQTGIPEVSGNIVQEVGFAVSTTEIIFKPFKTIQFG